jgi:hypothetical protein
MSVMLPNVSNVLQPSPDRFRLRHQAEELSSCEGVDIENDFQKKCRKGAKFAAHTAFSAILGEISCLFSLALEFFTRFRGGSFQPLTHLSGRTVAST